MEPSVQIFNNPQFGAIRVSKQDNDALFCAADICSALGYTNGRKAVSDHVDVDDVTKRDTIDNLGRTQQVTYINESGLYSLILTSKLPTAKQFKHWVTSEVLPMIRKTGGYIQSSADESPDVIMAKALQVAAQTIENNKQRLQMLEDEMKQKAVEVKKLEPKATYTDEVLQSTSTYTLTQISHDLGLRSVYSLTDVLKKHGILFYQSGQWQPTAKVADKRYFTTRTARYFKSDGTIGTSISTVVTELGRVYLHNKFNTSWKESIK